MRTTSVAKHVSLCLTSLTLAASVQAAPQTFFATNATAVTALTEQASFIAATSGVVSEGFETAALGRPAAAGLSVFGGAGLLTQASTAQGVVARGLTLGRFNTTPGCNVATACNWWQSTTSFDITLGGLKSAFGFFATDVGDLAGAITLDFWNDASSVRSGIAVTGPGQNVTQLFFGFIDDQFTFNRVTVNVVQTNTNPILFDTIGFDDILSGNRATTGGGGGGGPVTPVSTPASLALVALGLGLMAATRRHIAVKS